MNPAEIRAGKFAIEAIASFNNDIDPDILWKELASEGLETVMEFLYTLIGFSAGLLSLYAEETGETEEEILSRIAFPYENA